jgi:fluoride exporter
VRYIDNALFDLLLRDSTGRILPTAAGFVRLGPSIGANMSSPELPRSLPVISARRLAATSSVALAVLLAAFADLGVYFWIAVGSATGGMARYWCSGIAARLWGETFPWGTLLINVIGSFVIGFFATLTGPDGRVFVGSTARQFVMVGICGGYTTFSSFSLQTLKLLNEGEWLSAGANIGGSVGFCLLAAWAGYALATSLNTLKTM